MAKSMKDELLAALKTNTLMSETDLDALVASQDCEVAFAPYVLPPKPLEEEPPSSANILGLADDGVPQELHLEKTRLAQRGEIPVTSLQQRRRQKATAGSGYLVPNTLEQALVHGYILLECGAPLSVVTAPPHVSMPSESCVSGD